MIKYFWLILSLLCIAWYLVIFVYVVVRGGADIKAMLAKLGAGMDDSAEDVSQKRVN
jgi:hypothetical protein